LLVFFLAVKPSGHKVDHLHPSSVEAKNEQCYNSSPLYALMQCTQTLFGYCVYVCCVVASVFWRRNIILPETWHVLQDITHTHQHQHKHQMHIATAKQDTTAVCVLYWWWSQTHYTEKSWIWPQDFALAVVQHSWSA